LFAFLLLGIWLVIRTFAVGLMFGTILAIAAWPLRNWLVHRNLSSRIAAGIMLILALFVVLLPVIMIAPGLADDVQKMTEYARDWLAMAHPVPGWIEAIPFAGSKLAQRWQDTFSGTRESQDLIEAYVDPVRKFFISAALSLGSSIVQLAIAFFVATTFWVQGESVAQMIWNSLNKLGGERMAEMAGVANKAVKGVFYGVVGTAAIQGALMAAGMLFVGVPAALPLGFVTMLLAMSQIGAPLLILVWGGAAWWLHAVGLVWEVWFIIVWGIFVTILDNLLKPYLIGTGIRMPLSLIMIGVFGGFSAFGFLGLFIGPAVIAMAHAMLNSWHRVTEAD
jgi:predicted PurR-regulated permease PerM